MLHGADMILRHTKGLKGWATRANSPSVNRMGVLLIRTMPISRARPKCAAEIEDWQARGPCTTQAAGAQSFGIVVWHPVRDDLSGG
ncbi:hypothetical protein GCM10010442_33370 [Kitasatospora kifunensis]